LRSPQRPRSPTPKGQETAAMGLICNGTSEIINLLHHN
jgi:hypothetical protein